MHILTDTQVCNKEKKHSIKTLDKIDNFILFNFFKTSQRLTVVSSYAFCSNKAFVIFIVGF